MIDTFRTGAVPDEAIEAAVREVFDLTPLGIIKALSLRNPIYRATASYGHFGRTPEHRRFVDKDVNKDVDLFTWEQTNRVEDLRLAVQRRSEERRVGKSVDLGGRRDIKRKKSRRREKAESRETVR